MERLNRLEENFTPNSQKIKKFTLILHQAYSNETQRFEDLHKNLPNQTANTLCINDIFEELKTRGFNYTNTAISYYDRELNSFIYCGIFPLAGNVTIPLMPLVELKLRQIIKKDNLMRMELKEENVEENENNENVFINVKSKRSKERKIGYIIEKVFLWRKLYNGFKDEQGNLIKLTLEEAAEKVGISKKSLDDYLIQLRIGKQHGFLFNEHKNDKVGVLRAFVKKHKYEELNINAPQGTGNNLTFHGYSQDRK